MGADGAGAPRGVAPVSPLFYWTESYLCARNADDGGPHLARVRPRPWHHQETCVARSLRQVIGAACATGVIIAPGEWTTSARTGSAVRPPPPSR